MDKSLYFFKKSSINYSQVLSFCLYFPRLLWKHPLAIKINTFLYLFPLQWWLKMEVSRETRQMRATRKEDQPQEDQGQQTVCIGKTTEKTEDCGMLDRPWPFQGSSCPTPSHYGIEGLNTRTCTCSTESESSSLLHAISWFLNADIELFEKLNMIQADHRHLWPSLTYAQPLCYLCSKAGLDKQESSG